MGRRDGITHEFPSVCGEEEVVVERRNESIIFPIGVVRSKKVV
jgi:hypothetical protein